MSVLSSPCLNFPKCLFHSRIPPRTPRDIQACLRRPRWPGQFLGHSWCSMTSTEWSRTGQVHCKPDAFRMLTLGSRIWGGRPEVRRLSHPFISRAHTVNTTSHCRSWSPGVYQRPSPGPPSLSAERPPHIHCQPEGVNTSSPVFNRTSEELSTSAGALAGLQVPAGTSV